MRRLVITWLVVGAVNLLESQVTRANDWSPVESVFLPVVRQPWWNSVCSGMVVQELIVGGGFEVDHEANWIVESGARPECDPYVFMWNYHGIPYPRPHQLRLQQCLDYDALVTNASLIGRYARDTGKRGDLVAAKLQYAWSPFSAEPEDLEPGDYFAMSLTACPDPAACAEHSSRRVEVDRQKLWHGAQFQNHYTLDVTEALLVDIGAKRFEIMHGNDAEGHGSGAFIDDVSLQICTRP